MVLPAPPSRPVTRRCAVACPWRGVALATEGATKASGTSTRRTSHPDRRGIPMGPPSGWAVSSRRDGERLILSRPPLKVNTAFLHIFRSHHARGRASAGGDGHRRRTAAPAVQRSADTAPERSAAADNGRCPRRPSGTSSRRRARPPFQARGDLVALVRAGSARHREPLVLGGHERSRSASENRRLQAVDRTASDSEAGWDRVRTPQSPPRSLPRSGRSDLWPLW
jgi:hypothetical protein